VDHVPVLFDCFSELEVFLWVVCKLVTFFLGDLKGITVSTCNILFAGTAIVKLTIQSTGVQPKGVHDMVAETVGNPDFTSHKTAQMSPFLLL